MVWTRKPHRNALSKQEYRSGQQNKEIKSLVDLKRRNVGETRGENYSNIFFLFFFFNMRKAKQISHVRRSRKGEPEVGKNIQGKPTIDWKMVTRTTIDRKIAHKSDCESAKVQLFASCLQFVVGSSSLQYLQVSSPSNSGVPPRVNWRYFAGQLGSSFISEFPHLVQPSNLN